MIMSRFLNRRLLWAIITVSLILFVVSCLSDRQTLKAVAIESHREYELNSLVLPEGIEESWIFYIKQRLAHDIKREGRNLKIYYAPHLGAEAIHDYVSINYPYKIECGDLTIPELGISVSFGLHTDEIISVSFTGPFSYDKKNEPELGVSPSSTAAHSLNKKLCHIISEWMTAVTK